MRLHVTRPSASSRQMPPTPRWVLALTKSYGWKVSSSPGSLNCDQPRLQALVRWGGALLELAHYKQGGESTDMIQQASFWKDQF